MLLIGVYSVPVIMITGAFVGMTLALQPYDQLAGIGLKNTSSPDKYLGR